MSERELMGTVKSRWAKVINTFCKFSSVRPSFVAALIANESGGNADARRFEPHVYDRLRAIAEGKRKHMGAVNLEGIEVELEESRHSEAYHNLFIDPAKLFLDPGLVIADLATSWGLTQIMGYHMIGQKGVPRDLLYPAVNIKRCLQLLSTFAKHYELDLTCEYKELARCWNTGIPTGKTYHVKYVPNILHRMEVYENL